MALNCTLGNDCLIVCLVFVSDDKSGEDMLAEASSISEVSKTQFFVKKVPII